MLVYHRCFVYFKFESVLYKVFFEIVADLLKMASCTTIPQVVVAINIYVIDTTLRRHILPVLPCPSQIHLITNNNFGSVL